MRLSRDNKVNDFTNNLVRLGWTVENGGKHTRLVSPSGKVKLTVLDRPGDHRAAQNWMHQVKRVLRDRASDV